MARDFSFVYEPPLKKYMNCTTFTFDLGYHVPCTAMNIVVAHHTKVIHNDALRCLVYNFELAASNSKREKELQRAVLYYEHRMQKLNNGGDEKTVEKIIQIHHEPLNIIEDRREDLDLFLSFFNMLIHNEWYVKLTMDKHGGSDKIIAEKFYRLPFQQLMLLYTCFTMIERCQLGEYKEMILMYVKDKIGLSWMTPLNCRTVVSLLYDKKAVGFVVPRRCGKSSFTESLIAICLVMCTRGGIRAVYTAHEGTLVDNVLEKVLRNINRLICDFNKMQHMNYMSRQQCHTKAIRKAMESACGDEEVERLKALKQKDYHYVAVGFGGQRDSKKIQVKFYKRRLEVLNAATVANDISKMERPSSMNFLICRVYKRTDTLRGQTLNLIYVDETNFIKPTIYQEVLPMLNTGNARMICMSSQKNGQDKKSFVDLTRIRIKSMLMCSVSYVCAAHALAMITDDRIKVSKCLCYFFSQPFHINPGGDYRNLCSAFSVRSGGAEDGTRESKLQAKISLLAEIGVMPPGLSKQDLLKMNITNMKLATQAGHDHIMTSSMQVMDYVVHRSKTDLVFDNSIVVYVDPSPHDRNTSFNAMCFVTRARKPDYNTCPSIQKYVILGVEEFSTEDVDSVNKDVAFALAKVFIYHVAALTTIYNGYFDEVIVVPENNSSSLFIDRFWVLSQQLLCLRKYQMLDRIKIFCPIVEVSDSGRPISRAATERKRKRDPYSVENLVDIEETAFSNTRQDTLDEAAASSIYPCGSIERRVQHMINKKRKSGSLGLYDVTSGIPQNGKSLTEVLQLNYMQDLANQSQAITDSIEMDKRKKYKLGYTLGNEKFKMFCSFFNSCYNKMANNSSDLTLASSVMSHCNQNCNLTLNMNLRQFLVNKMDKMEIRLERNRSGQMRLTVTGKPMNKKYTSDHDQVVNPHLHSDDLAVALICSVSLYSNFVDHAQMGSMIRLKKASPAPLNADKDKNHDKRSFYCS